MVDKARRIPACPAGAFWVFGYGSLMWHPGFDYTDRREARLYGYRRALCILSFEYRGTRDAPGLVFGLDAGGSCVGRAFRVPASRREETFDYLMEREMITNVYMPRWLNVHTRSGPVEALCFVADRRHEQYTRALSEHEIANRIRRARGRKGPNLDYLVNTCRHLEELGMCSPALARIRDTAAGRSMVSG